MDLDTAICSGDNIVYRIMGATNRGEQGISMGEVLSAIGLTYNELPHNFKKQWREKMTREGSIDGFSGICFKK